MPGHDDIDIHGANPVTGADPVGDGAGPHQRRAVYEQDVAGEHRAV